MRKKVQLQLRKSSKRALTKRRKVEKINNVRQTKVADRVIGKVA